MTCYAFAARRPGPPAAEGSAGPAAGAAAVIVVGADGPGRGVPGRRAVQQRRRGAHAGLHAGPAFFLLDS